MATRRRYLILGAVLCLAALQQSDRPRFIHPKRRIVSAGADIPVQAWIGRHAENRAVSLSWAGVGCAGGSSAKTLEGDNEAAVYPEHWDSIKVRMGAGRCELSVYVLGAGGKVRGSARLEVCAIGFESPC